MLTKADILKDLKTIGVEKGDLLHLKVSMRAIGKLENGVYDVLDALLEAVGEEGTIVSDAFIIAYPLPLNEEDAEKIPDDMSKSYAGVFANTMIKHSKNFRSKHPIQKFAAIGKMAEQLCSEHTYEKGGYYIVEKMAELDAKNLTIGGKVVGVGTTHVAIEHLGFKRKEMNKGINYKDENGQIQLAKINWNGGCGNGFPNFIPLFYETGGILGDSKIGYAPSILTSMKKTLDVEKAELQKDGTSFFCNDPACYSCRISWEHSEKKHVRFVWSWLKANYKGISFGRFKVIYKSRLKKNK